MKIGVLALQGDFAEHQSVLASLDADVVQVRLPEHLVGLNGLVIPGGESTTMGKLAEHYNLMQPLRQFGREHAIWGTCAGAILLAKEVGRAQPLLGLMDITIARNAFGRQVDSFEADLAVPALLAVDPVDRPFHTIFIRAPIIESVGKGVEVLSALEDGRIVAVRQGHFLATSFHPELTGDDRFHRYFMELSK